MTDYEEALVASLCWATDTIEAEADLTDAQTAEQLSIAKHLVQMSEIEDEDSEEDEETERLRAQVARLKSACQSIRMTMIPPQVGGCFFIVPQSAMKDLLDALANT